MILLYRFLKHDLADLSRLFGSDPFVFGRERTLATLRISLIGSPTIELDGTELPIQPRKALALLIYLAVTGENQRRDTLATLLWPEASQARARAALSRRLSELRSALGAGWIEIAGEQVRLRAANDAGDRLWLDVAEFWRQLNACQNHGHPAHEACAACVDPLQTAAALYRSGFLSGFTLRDSAVFDEWQFFQAERLRQAQAFALARLVQWYLEHDDAAAALPHARAWLALDSLHEPAHRSLMRIYSRLGQRSAALRQYEECRRRLQEELNVAPEAATQTLYAKIRRTAPPPADLASPTPSPSAREDIELSPTVTSVCVGRARPLADLAAALDAAYMDQGQLRFVTGEAGQGKSLLVQEFARRAQAAKRDLLVVTGYCDAYTGIGDPYLPWREALTLLTGAADPKLTGAQVGHEQARRLWAALPITLPALVQHAPDLIGSFIAAQSLLDRAAASATPHSVWLKQLQTRCRGAVQSPQDEHHIFRQYAELLRAIAAAQPILLIVEDLHWIDRASSALLFHLSRTLHDSRIMIVGTYRPEEVKREGMRPPGSEAHPMAEMIGELKRRHGEIWIDLDDLAAAEGRQFVDAYLDSEPNRLDDAFRTTLFRHTQGHALFTAELVRAMQTRGDVYRAADGRWVASPHVDWQMLPARIEGVIEKQLARLEVELLDILRVACVQGELFSAEVVARVLQRDEQSVVVRLSQELGRRLRLVSAQDLVWLGQQRLSRYRFRHYLFQRYLYQSLDETERAYLHQAVAHALEDVRGRERGEIAVQLAHHYRQAGMIGESIAALLEAGHHARQLAAHQAAIQHLTEAQSLLPSLAEGRRRLQHEADLLLALGMAMDEAGDTDTNELERIFLRARALCERLGDGARLAVVLYWIASVHFARGEYLAMHSCGEEMVQISQGHPSAAVYQLANLIMGIALQMKGDFHASTTYLEQMLSHGDDPQREDRLGYPLSGPDPRVLAFEHLAINAWILGYPDRARRHDETAMRIATETNSPYTLAMALFMSAGVYEMGRQGPQLRAQLAAAMQIASERSYRFVLSHARLLEGCSLVEQGQAQAGLALQLQAIAELNANRLTKTPGYFAALLAGSYLALKRGEAGLEAIDVALARIGLSGEHWYEAELYRLKGELLQMMEVPAAVIEETLGRALRIAREQQAKLWELRAAASLVRFRQAQSPARRRQAHAQLAEVYRWFTEGFDTPDLLEAKALLNEQP